MDEARQARIVDILDAVLDVSQVDRETVLKEACRGDADLMAEVRELLALETEVEEFLPRSPLLDHPNADSLNPGDRLGPYQILELIGRGGMGSVYRASRQDDFEKVVAVKLVSRSVFTAATVRRFHRERQILARLEHPHIARLLDGGTSEDGRPYLVMEHISGIPLDEYCAHHDLDLHERIRLFRSICDAVAFAHQNLVVHRDLKPSNILVDHRGQAKLLDFGIAKLLDTDTENPLDLTRTLERPMTPRYASPEQVLGQPVTPASDLYTLGVLLYQLLTGHLPCGLDDCTWQEAHDRIRQVEPLRPSIVVRRDSATSGEQIEPATAGHLLKGDLDAILLKALRKEPRQRYASAEQLGEDLRRYETGLPVLARKGTNTYLLSKFIRRHRWGLSVMLLAILAVSGFLVRERQRAEFERQRAEEVTSVLRSLLDIADPDRRDEEAMIEALGETQEQVSALRLDPTLRTELESTLGRIYYKLGRVDQALALMKSSRDAWQRLYPEDLSGIAARSNNLATLYLEHGQYELAESHLRQTMALYSAEPTPGDDLVVTYNNLASVLLYQGRFADAEALYRRGLELRRSLFGEADPRTSNSLRSLGALLLSRGDFAAAEPVLTESLAIRRATYGDEHSRVASVLDLLGRARFGLGDLATAETFFERALQIRRQRFGAQHILVARSQRNLAHLLLTEGAYETAGILLGQSLATAYRALPPEDWRIADAESVLGELWLRQGRLEQAEPCLTGSYEQLRSARGDNAWPTRQAAERRESLRQARQPRAEESPQ